jgi:hypothetical protein
MLRTGIALAQNRLGLVHWVEFGFTWSRFTGQNLLGPIYLGRFDLSIFTWER